MNNQNLYTLLKTKKFLPLFITQFLGAFNDNIFKNAFVILITYKLSEISSMRASLLIAIASGLFILPFFLFSATAGQLADKLEKSRLITMIKFIEVCLMIVATFGFYYENISLLLFVLFALGTHAAFFGPVKYAILPDLVQENELIAGNGLIEAGTFLSILLGTILGGVCILHSHGVFIISSLILFCATVGWVSSFFIPRTAVTNQHIKINLNFMAETLELLRYSRRHWDLFSCILAISWFWLVGATFLANLPSLAKEIIHANGSVVTYFLTLFSLGIGIGSLACHRLLKGEIHATYTPLGALGMSLFMFDLYFAIAALHPYTHIELMTLSQFLSHLSGWRISIDLLFIAICGGLYTVPLYTILQHRSDSAHRARVIASNNIVNALAMVAAAIFVSFMIKIHFTVNHIFFVLALGNTVLAFYILKLLPDILIKSIFRWVLTTLYRVKVVGLEHYQEAGKRVVIIANHTSYLDAILLATFLPGKVTFAINTFTAKKWWIRFFMRMVHTYSIDPTNPMAVKSLIEFVEQDKRCIIFPEGRLSVTGSLMKIYEGPGLVADKSNAKLLPIHIDGPQHTAFSRLKGKVPYRLLPKITINIFPPQELQLSPGLSGRKRRQLIGQKLYDYMVNAMFESGDYHQTLFSTLIQAKATYGRSYEIIEDIEREPTTYQQFLTRCFILGNVIAKQTKRGEKVGILLPNAVPNAITFFAMQAYCRVPAMLNFTSGPRNVLSACQTAQIKTIYTSHKFVRLAQLEEMVNTLKEHGHTIIYLEDLRQRVGILQKLKGALLAQIPTLAYKLVNWSKAARACMRADQPAVILFTSGSEGTPKGVVLSHINLQANRHQLTASVDFNVNDRVFNALPIFHSFGLTAGMLLPFLSGVRVFFYPSPLHYRIVPELAYDTNATILFGTDTFLTGYAKYAHPYDFYSVRYIFAGAEKLREETRQIWSEKFGIRIFEGYGTTETSPVIATNTPMHHKVGSVGRLLPGIQYRLNPVEGIKDGGSLQVHGPNIMQGYISSKNPGEILPPEQGWYDTGDIAKMDDDGFLSIVGRIKRFAKIGGEMISLALIEQYIQALWPEAHHAVVNLPDAKKGEQIVLVTTQTDAKREDMLQHAKQAQLTELAIPKKVLFVKDMFVLGTGKTDYTKVKDFALSALA